MFFQRVITELQIGYGAGSGWGNVTGGHKQAKNVIAVANLTSIANLLIHPAEAC